MEYLKVKNWENYQHYKNRCPPWIKLHVTILNDRKFSMLSCASKGLLMQLWILASEYDGQVPFDINEIQFRLRDNKIKMEDLNILIKLGFLNNCKHVQASDSVVQAGACLETETETETETEKNSSQRKKKKVSIPPSLAEVIKYFFDNGYSVDVGKRAFEGYNVADWHDTNGKPVLNWKQKMNNVWFKDENKAPVQTLQKPLTMEDVKNGKLEKNG